MRKRFLIAWLAGLMVVSSGGLAQADIVSIIDPNGGQEIENEVGTLSEAAFEALSPSPTVQDWEGIGAMVGDNSPFSLGGVTVTGIYRDTRVEESFSPIHSMPYYYDTFEDRDPDHLWKEPVQE